MNKKVLSMVIAIVLIGMSLISLGIQYARNQNEIAVAQKLLDEENSKVEKEAKENGDIFYTTSDQYYNSVDELQDKFVSVIIIHSIIIGFIILSEIGILLVLPKKDKTLNVVINNDNKNNNL
jgi:hypothetical protein